MKKTRSILMVLSLVMVFALIGCGAKTPTKTVEEFFNSIKKAEFNNDLLVNSVLEVEDSEDELSDETMKKLEKAISKFSYKINEEKIDGDTATVNVTVESIDFGIVMGKMMQESIGFFLGQAFTGQEITDEQSNAYFEELLNKYLDEITYSEKTNDVNLVKEDDQWKINEDSNLTVLIWGMDLSAFEDME